MNEEAIRDAYNLFVNTGYKKSYEEFKQLINSNPEALQDAYGLFVNTGYKKDINSFKTLMGVGGAMPAQPQEEVKKKEQPGVMEQVQDVMSGTMVSQSAGSSSASQSLPKPTAEDLRKIKIEQPSETTQMQVNLPTKEDIAIMKQSLADQKIPTPKFYDEAINTITGDFIDRTEEAVVPQMNYQFGPMGFKFEESGMTGDWMVATAPNGQKKEFSLDPAFGIGAESTAEELRNWIKDNTQKSGLAALEKQYTAENRKFQTQEEIDTEYNKLNSQTEKFKNEVSTFLKDKTYVEGEIKRLNSLPVPERNKPENAALYQELLAKKNQLQSTFQTLQQQENEIVSNATVLDKSVGKYSMMRAEQGEWSTGIWNAITEGIGSMAAGTVNLAIDGAFSKYVAGVSMDEMANSVGEGVSTGNGKEDGKQSLAVANAYRINEQEGIELIKLPKAGQSYKDWYNSLREDQKELIVDKSNDDIKKDLKINLLPTIRQGTRIVYGNDDTSVEWSRTKEEGFWGGAILGVAKSLPAMVGSSSVVGWAQRTAQMYGQTSDAVYEEMSKNPEFDNISESEKLAVVAPIGIASAALESLGLRNIIANKGLMNRIVLGAMGKAGSTTTAKTFGELVKNEIESMGGRAALTLVGAGLAEAETGAAQQIVEYAVKDIYNMAKEKEMFQTPDFMSAEYIKDIAKAGAQEAVGGFVLGVPGAIGAAYTQKGYKSMSNAQFEAFEAIANDEKVQEAYIIKLKEQVSTGVVTAKEAKQKLNDYRNSVGLYRSIPEPEGLSIEGKKEAMNLLKEKRDLKEQIKDKDDALTKKQRARIEAIDSELEALTNQPEAAPEAAPSTGPIGNRVQVLTEEEDKRKTSLEQAIEQSISATPEGLDPLSVMIDGKLISFEEAQTELDAFNERLNQASGSSVLATPEATTSALESLPAGERTTITFTQEDGTETPVMGNENMLSNLYHQVQMVPEENRTDWQQSVLDAVTVSLKTQIDQEAETRTLEEMVAEEEKGDWIDNLNDNEYYSFEATNLEDVPEQFRDNVREYEPITATVRKKILGLPIGKKKTVELEGRAYTYTVSGREIKENKEAFLPKETNMFGSFSMADFKADIVPSYNRVVSTLITPATVRAFSPVTKKIKEMSLKYDKLVKSYAKNKSKDALAQIKELENKILNEAQQEIVNAVSKIKGVSVRFSTPKTGLWDGMFEPSFNMTLSISKDADTNSVSEMLFDFAEKYSQDAFILEMASEQEQDIREGKIPFPLTVFNEDDNTTTYPQISYKFATPLTDEQVAEISNKLQQNGVDAFSINNEEVTISVLSYPEGELSQEEEQQAKKEDYESKLKGAKGAIDDVLGGVGNGKLDIRIKKSKYIGHTNPKSEQTREYDRSDVLETFKQGIAEAEKFGLELGKLREKQIELEKRGEKLSPEEQARFEALSKIVIRSLEDTFESKKSAYEQSKTEVEDIARNAIKGLKGFISTFPIKRPARASIKTLRWYGSFSERLGDGARVNIIVESEEDANKVFESINNQFPVAEEDLGNLRRINEPTDLGYPKRLIEIRTPNGEIAEMQVMTIEGYLAKDGVESFTGDKGGVSKEESQNKAKERLQQVQSRLGWAIPDNLGHYFYEIQRDFNVDEALRNKAKELSLKYYDAFLNPNSKLTESFMDEVMQFKQEVDSADKSTWDNGNEGKAPKTLTNYLESRGIVEETKKEQKEKEVKQTASLSEVAMQLAEGDLENANKLIARLNKSFPNAKVYLEKEMFDNVMASEKVRKFVKNGMVIYGVTVDGDIYINPEVHNSTSELFNTSIHEFGHLWSNFLQTTARGKELYAKGVSLIEQAIKTDSKMKALYAEQLRKLNGDKKRALNEMVSILIGDKGAEITEKSLKQRFTNWLNAVFTFIKSEFKLSRELTSEQIQDMTLDQFIGTALADIFSGEPLAPNGTTMNNPDVAFSARQTPESIIKMGRANGFSEESIRKVLEGRGLTTEQIDAAMTEEQGASNRVTISEEIAAGFDRVLGEVDKIIAKMEERGASKKRKVEGVINYVMKSLVYEKATDVQREKMIREVRKKLGLSQRSAPALEREIFMGEGRIILGEIADVNRITMTEKELLKKQIRDLARGAKTAKIAWVKVSKQLSKEIKELVLAGKLTNRQVASIIRRFADVNMFNQDSIDKFVDYMTNVFEDSNYDKKIDDARRKLKTARTNVRTKIGVAEAAAPILTRLFSINPNLIPDSVLDKYLSLVNMFGAKGAVLTLIEVSDVVNTTNEILDAVNEEVSLAEELAIRFEEYEDKVINDKGKLDYAKTVAQMVKEGVISEDESKIMSKYKKIILPKVQQEPMTEAQIQAEKTRIINGIQGLTVNANDLPSRYERDTANRLKKLLNPSLLNKMTISQLNNVAKLIDNINNGYFPHYAQLTLEKLNDLQDAENLVKGIKSAEPLKFSKLYARFKSIFTGKDATLEMVRRSPLYFIDQLFGDFKTKTIFSSVFERLAEGHAAFESAMGRVNKKLDEAHDAVAKSHKYKINETLEASFRMMTYLVQLEYDTNPESKQVNSAADYIRATVKHIRRGKSKYKERDAQMLENILDKYGVVVAVLDNGKEVIEIDKNALFNDFNSAEKKAIETIREVNDGMRDMAMYTAAVIRGERIEALNNYVHLPVMHDYNPDERATGTQSADEYNNSIRPSTKAQSLIARTGKVSPINFDAFASAQRGAKFVLLDFNMTEAIRTSRKTLNEAERMMEEEGDFSKQDREILNAINGAFEEVVQNVLTNNFITNSFADEVMNFISKQGYRVILASTTRFSAELASNIGFVMVTDPKAFAEGVKYRSIIMSPLSVSVMDNVGSKQTTRLFHGDTLGGRFVDTSILRQASGVKSNTAQNQVTSNANMIYNFSLKKYKNLVEVVADSLISTPDKVVMRPIWFGTFATEFKNQTGQEVDFDKIAANDEAYMSQHRDAIDAARDKADERSVLTGATDNPFMGILKGTNKPNQSAFLRGFNNFNSFMTRFAIYEYTTARQGIYAAMGNGTITRKQGVAMLAGVTIRMTTYSLLSTMLANGLVSLVTDDEEPEDEKTFMQKLGQALASTGTGLILGRDFGNLTKGLINYGVEEMNDEFLTGLRDGEYDPYEDAISFTFIPRAKKNQKVNLTDFVTNMGGSFGPALKTSDLIARKLFEAPKKEEEAIERGKNETQIRIPLEVLGNLGYVPLYKDIRKVVMNELYKELDNAPKEAANKKAKEKAKLHGYENKTDLKRYAPDLYEQEFGAASPEYEAEQAEKKIEKEKEILERKMKDDLYDYVPKQEVKSGFGSKPFGGGTTKKKGGFGSGNTFGSKGFGK